MVEINLEQGPHASLLRQNGEDLTLVLGETASRVASSLALEEARTEALGVCKVKARECRPVGNSFEEARLESVDLGSERAERPDAPERRSSISSTRRRRKEIACVVHLVVHHLSFVLFEFMSIVWRMKEAGVRMCSIQLLSYFVYNQLPYAFQPAAFLYIYDIPRKIL